MITNLGDFRGLLSGSLFRRRFRRQGPHVCLIAPPVTKDRNILPLGLLALGGALKARGISAQLLDFDLAVHQCPDLAGEPFFGFAREKIRSSGALLFGITSLCANYPLALRLAALIKETVPGARVILGGPQASAVYEQTLRKFPAVDIVVVGEGEETLCDLVEGLHAGRDLAAIPGVAFRRGGSAVFAGPRPLIEDLDRLPLPDYDLVNLADYRDDEFDDYLEMEAGRGCPLRCTFCSTAPMWKRKFRAKSPERLLEEMTLLNERSGVRHFGFVHDNLTINPHYLKHLCDVFIAHGSPYRWSSSASLNTVKPETLDAMQAAGCSGIFIGIETGSPRVQKQIRKRVRLERAEAIVRHAHALGIRVDAAFIMGFPQEQRGDLDLTLKMALRLRKAGAERVFFSLFAPLAATALYQEYRPRLVLQAEDNSLGTLPFSFEGTLPMIQNNPELFSSFYRVPNPALEGLSLADLSTFVDEMIDWYTVAYDRLLDVAGALGLSPVELFEKWHAWFRIRTGEAGPVQTGRVFDTFPEFLESYEQEVLEQLGQVA